MIEIPIKQVTTKTVGGLAATIDALSPTSSDCLVGTLDTANGVKQVAWDKNGICRDNTPDCNLDMHVNEHIHATSVAGALHGQYEIQKNKRTQD